MAVSSPKRIGIGPTLAKSTDSGNHALHLALALVRKGLRPILLSVPDGLTLDPLHRRLLAPALEGYPAHRAAFARNRGRTLPFPVLHALGDRLSFPATADDTPGRPDIGVAGLQHTAIPHGNLQRAADWPLVIAGSSWATQTLRAKGLRNVVHVPPGIDPALFHPAPRAGLFPGRFVLFSGGSLDYRKGHDIVVAAFRAFRQRHPEALLICAWGSAPIESLHELASSPHLDGLPEVAGGVVQVGAWLARHGIPAESVIDLGVLSEDQMPGVLRECDLAVFPGRCEGGVPMPAMQALACGVPTVLAGNTGHLDLLGDHAYVLKEQGEVATLTRDAGKQGWGECAVDELLASLERASIRRSEAAHKGQAGARFMASWTWDCHADRLLAAVHRAVAGESVPPPDAGEDYRWGLCLHRASRLAEAQQVYDQILERAPGHVGARMDRGHARRERGDAAGAEAEFRALLSARPGHPHALQGLGNLLRREGRLDDAVDCLRGALAGTDAPSMHWDLAFTLLLMGRYAEAWPHFEHRHAALGLRTAASTKPRWDGRLVAGGTLLVLDEQGLGDTLQFLRFLPLIPVGPGGRVIFAGKPDVLSVVRRVLPPADVFSWDEPLPRAQAWVPLMSLPERLGVMQPRDVPPPALKLLVEPERVARWRPQVREADDRPVLGLCWRGNPEFSGDAQRSPGLAVLQPVLDVPGLRFVSLQVGPGRGEIAGLGLSDRVADLGHAIEAAGTDILDTLAVLENCDFVVSSCTSVAHMAGLMGRPGRVLVSQWPDWRWMMDRADTPWYPSLQLIRQRAIGRWADVATEAAAQVVAWRADNTKTHRLAGT